MKSCHNEFQIIRRKTRAKQLLRFLGTDRFFVVRIQDHYYIHILYLYMYTLFCHTLVRYKRDASSTWHLHVSLITPFYQ